MISAQDDKLLGVVQFDGKEEDEALEGVDATVYVIAEENVALRVKCAISYFLYFGSPALSIKFTRS